MIVRPAFASNFGTVYGEGAPLALLFASNFASTSIIPLPPTPAQNDSSADLQLMRQIRGRQSAALSQVYDLYSSLVYSIAMRVLRDPAAAEDVMQEVFLKLWQQPDTFSEHRGSLCGWLTVIARNRAIDRVRVVKRFENVDDLQLPNGVDLSSEAERAMQLEKIRNILGTMPSEQRQSVEMAFFEGRTHAEIAEITGQPLGTVKTRIRAALIAIRKVLETPA